MKSYRIPKEAQFDGLDFTDLNIIGYTRGAAGVSDFTAAATNQVFDLVNLTNAASSILAFVHYPLWMIRVKTATLPTTTNMKVDLGIAASGTGDTTLFAGSASDLETAGAVYLPTNAIAPTKPSGASQYLTANVTSASGNVSTLTAGEIWIFTHLVRTGDWDRVYAGE